MSKSFVRTLCWGGTPLLLVLSQPSAAAAAERALRFHFATESSCGSAESFVAGVKRRLPSLRLTQVPGRAPVSIELRRQGKEVEARLAIALRNGGQLERTLQAPSCSQAVDAIAFVAAVALDPAASAPVAVDERVGEESTPPSAAAVESPEPVSAEPVPAQASEAWEAGLALGPQVYWGPAPAPLIGGELGFDLGAAAAGWWAPSLHLGAAANYRGVEEAGGSASFLLSTAGVDLCPSRGEAGGFRVRLCAHGEAGMMRASGAETTDATTSWRPWALVGGRLFLELDLGAGWGVGARGTVGAALIRDSYQFEPTVFYRASAVAGAAGCDLFLRF